MQYRIAAVAAALVLLAACTPATPAESTVAEPTVDTTKSEETIFLEMARPLFPGVSDAKLFGLADQVCHTIGVLDGDTDAFIEGLAEELAGTSSRSDLEDYGFFAGISIMYACPEYK